MNQGHTNGDIEVYYATETNEYTYRPDIFGVYKMQAELKNGRNFYKNGKYSVWCENTSIQYYCWCIEDENDETTNKNTYGLAHSKFGQKVSYPNQTADGTWIYNGDGIMGSG